MKPIDRLMMKVTKTETCWIWKGTLLERGYGVISFQGKQTTAHRLSYILHHGPIGEGLIVMHTCDNPSCVNPDHLVLGSRSENNYDRSEKRRTVSFNGMTLIERFDRNIEKTDGCWLWKGSLGCGKGYGVISVNGKARSAHRVSYEINVGPILEGMVIRHLCNNPSCVRPDHLMAGTIAENAADRVKSGRTAHGMYSGHAKVSEDQVIEMRRLYQEGTSMTDLAEKYALDSAGICAAINGTNWAHVPGAIKEKMYGTQEWKDRISKGKMGVLPSPEHLAKIRAARAKPRSAEYRQKLGACHKGVPSWNKGIPMREESKRKLSEAKKGRIPWNKGKRKNVQTEASLIEDRA